MVNKVLWFHHFVIQSVLQFPTAIQFTVHTYNVQSLKHIANTENSLCKKTLILKWGLLYIMYIYIYIA